MGPDTERNPRSGKKDRRCEASPWRNHRARGDEGRLPERVEMKHCHTLRVARHEALDLLQRKESCPRRQVQRLARLATPAD